MKRKIAAIGMTIFMLLGLSGCGESYEEKNEAMLLHMQEKYGVEFEIQYYIPRNVDCSYDVWCCNAVGDDPELDKIEVHRYYGDMAKDGEYADEYYTRIIREEIEGRAMEAISQVTDQAKVYLGNFEYADEEYTELDQLDEYLQTDEGRYAIGLIVYILDREKEGIMNQTVIDQLTPVMREAGVGDARLRVFFIKNMELFQQLDRKTQHDLIFSPSATKEIIYTCDYSGRIEDELTKW